MSQNSAPTSQASSATNAADQNQWLSDQQWSQLFKGLSSSVDDYNNAINAPESGAQKMRDAALQSFMNQKSTIGAVQAGGNQTMGGSQSI